MGFTKPQKPKAIGSIYVNAKKNSDEDTQDTIAQAVEALKEAGAVLNLSIKKADGSYAKFIGFFNGYKDEESKPDIMIYPSMQMGGKKKFNKFAKKQAEVEEADEDQDEEEEQAPPPKKKFAKKASDDDSFAGGVPF